MLSCLSVWMFNWLAAQDSMSRGETGGEGFTVGDEGM